MKTKFILFSLSFALHAHATMTTPFMFKDDAAAALRINNLEVVSASDDATIYTGDRTSGFQLLVSKGGFKTLVEAQKFCAAHLGFELGNTAVVQYLLKTGLPFPELWPVSFIQVPVLFSANGLAPGVVLWFKLSPSQKAIVSSRSADLKNAMDADDYVFVVSDLADPSTWGLQALSEVNHALQSADVPSVNIPAVCASIPKTLEPTP